MFLEEKFRESRRRKQRRAGDASDEVLIDGNALRLGKSLAHIHVQRGFQSEDERVELVRQRDLERMRVAAFCEIVEADEAQIDIVSFAPAAGNDREIGLCDVVDAQMKETSGSGKRRSVGKQKIGESDRLERMEEEGEEGYWREKREGNRGDLLKRRKGEEEKRVIFKVIVQ